MADARTLEERLGSLSEWDGGETALWRDTIGRSKRGKRAGFLWRPSVRVAALFVLLVAVAGALLPSLEEPRRNARTQPSSPAPQFSLSSIAPSRDALSDTMSNSSVRAPRAMFVTRAITRTATLDLRVEDVHSAFFLLPGVLDDALGEHVQTSSIRGDGDEAFAELTLRVVSDRLDDALSGLRALGNVASESVKATDVTDQLVDLEARLRNTKRVERELLSLLESRADAPLEDVLELQRALGEVRESVERLAAQRAALSQRAEMATVRVTLRAVETAKNNESDESSFGSYFTDRIGGAWHEGVRALVSGVAMVVRGVVGGLLVWIALGVVGVFVYRMLATRSAKAAALALRAPVQSEGASSA